MKATPGREWEKRLGDLVYNLALAIQMSEHVKTMKGIGVDRLQQHQTNVQIHAEKIKTFITSLLTTIREEVEQQHAIAVDGKKEILTAYNVGINDCLQIIDSYRV